MVPADMAWMLVATALVLLMTPALAFFYGGLVRSKNALNTMMMSFISLGFVGVVWALLGYSLGASRRVSPSSASCRQLLCLQERRSPRARGAPFRTCCSWPTRARSPSSPPPSSPAPSSSAWGSAPTSPSSPSGRSASIARSRTGCGAAAGSCTTGALDFAGGTVVHINAGRRGAGGGRGARPAQGLHAPGVSCRTTCRSCCSAPACSGSAGSASTPAARSRPSRFARRSRSSPRCWRRRRRSSSGRCSTPSAPARVDRRRRRHRPSSSAWSPSRRRPASSARSARSALGGIAAVPSYFALVWRVRTRLDDSLDVVAAHGVGGTVGALLTGVFAQKSWNTLADGALFGNPYQVVIQLDLDRRGDRLRRGRDVHPPEGGRPGLQPARRRRGLGLDVTQHGEEAYTRGEGAILVLPGVEAPTVAARVRLTTEGGRA